MLSCSSKYVEKSLIQAVSSPVLLDELNALKSTILERKKKLLDDTVIQIGSLICKSCITTANRLQTPASTSAKRRTSRQLSVHPIYRVCNEANTSSDSDSSDSSYEGETGNVTDKIIVDIPRTIAIHKKCVVCFNRRNLVTVPKEAFFDAFIKKNILIPNDCRCCKEHLDKDKTFNDVAMNNLASWTDRTKLKDFEVKMLPDNLRHSAKTGLFTKFAKTSTITERECIRYTGLTKEQFRPLKNDLVSLKDSPERTKVQALATYLFWIKTGLDY